MQLSALGVTYGSAHRPGMLPQSTQYQSPDNIERDAWARKAASVTNNIVAPYPLNQTRRCEEELPEKVIGAIRLVSLDLDQAEPLLEPGETAPS